jgi:hypothetical protein
MRPVPLAAQRPLAESGSYRSRLAALGKVPTPQLASQILEDSAD